MKIGGEGGASGPRLRGFGMGQNEIANCSDDFSRACNDSTTKVVTTVSFLRRSIWNCSDDFSRACNDSTTKVVTTVSFLRRSIWHRQLSFQLHCASSPTKPNWSRCKERP